jgi:hypothetical protein
MKWTEITQFLNSPAIPVIFSLISVLCLLSLIATDFLTECAMFVFEGMKESHWRKASSLFMLQFLGKHQITQLCLRNQQNDSKFASEGKDQSHTSRI